MACSEYGFPGAGTSDLVQVGFGKLVSDLRFGVLKSWHRLGQFENAFRGLRGVGLAGSGLYVVSLAFMAIFLFAISAPLHRPLSRDSSLLPPNGHPNAQHN